MGNPFEATGANAAAIAQPAAPAPNPEGSFSPSPNMSKEIVQTSEGAMAPWNTSMTVAKAPITISLSQIAAAAAQLQAAEAAFLALVAAYNAQNAQ